MWRRNASPKAARLIVSPRGAFILIGAEDVECDAAQSGQILGSVVLLVAGMIFVDLHAEYTVQTVFDVTMAAHDVKKARGRQRCRKLAIALGIGRLAVDLAHGLGLAGSLEAMKAVLLGERTRAD